MFIVEQVMLHSFISFAQQVLCQLYDNKYTKLKDEYDTDIDLDLNPYNPTFDLKFEFREFSYPPTTTILFKVI